MLRRVAIAAFLAAVALSSGGFVAVSARTSSLPTFAGTSLPLQKQGLVQPLTRSGVTEGSMGNSEFSATGRELFFKTMLSVLLVIVLGAAAIYTSRKLLPRITNPLRGRIRILETAHLGPKKAVHLLEIGNQKLLIGSTNEGITTLADVTEALTEFSTQQVDNNAKI